MIFCSSGARAAWELSKKGESVYGGCHGGAARCGKLSQRMLAPRGGYSSARLFLANELVFATLCMSTAVLAEALPEGGSVLGNQRGAGKPIGEIHVALREPTSQVDMARYGL